MADRLTDSQMLKLVEIYRDYECLWNVTSNLYKNQDARKSAYKEILQRLNIPGLSLRDIPRKIKNLRSSYYQELKRIENSIRSGASHDSIYEPKVSWFTTVDSFLKPFRHKRDSFFHESNVVRHSEKDIDTTETNLSEDNDEKDSHEKESEFIAPTVNKIRKRSRPRRDQSSTSVETLSFLQNMYEPQRRDEFDVFGEHVAIKLRKLKNSCAKNTAQFHINNILYNADMGDYDYPSSDRWSHRNQGISTSSRSMSEESSFRRHTSGPTFASDSSNDGSVSTIDDPIKCEAVLENQ